MDKTNIPMHRLAEMSKSPRSSPNASRIIEVLTYPAAARGSRRRLRIQRWSCGCGSGRHAHDVCGHLADDLSLSVLADHAGMSERYGK
jgi:hypothetical protein